MGSQAATDLHIFFMPLLAPGHMIPAVDLAKLLVARGGVRCTVVTTAGNAALIQPTIDRTPHLPIAVLTLPFPSAVPDNITALPTPRPTPEFVAAINAFKTPFKALLDSHRPDCIVSDLFYPWTLDLADELRIPRLTFHGSSSFTSVMFFTFATARPQDAVAADDEPFLIPNIPHRVEMIRSQLPSAVAPDEEIYHQILRAESRTYGVVMNSVFELEPEYAARHATFKNRIWDVGPVSLCNHDGAARGGGAADAAAFLKWLDAKPRSSVLYISFGSSGRFTVEQLREMAAGLESCAHPFIWVVAAEGKAPPPPEGFEERGKGLIIRGWAPQILLLNHPAVGGFMTHCGWNSCLEAATAGLPMITWPMFADQFFNERLVVDVLRIGVAVGVRVNSGKEEERTVVKAEGVKKAVDELMGRGGEEAEERRRRAKEIAEMARTAVAEGGSSYNGLSSLIQELMDIKAGKLCYRVGGDPSLVNGDGNKE